jgi:hypothetical protein
MVAVARAASPDVNEAIGRVHDSATNSELGPVPTRTDRPVVASGQGRLESGDLGRRELGFECGRGCLRAVRRGLVTVGWSGSRATCRSPAAPSPLSTPTSMSGSPVRPRHGPGTAARPPRPAPPSPSSSLRTLRHLAVAGGVTPQEGAMAQALRHADGMDLAMRGVPLSVIQDCSGTTTPNDLDLHRRPRGEHLRRLADARAL